MIKADEAQKIEEHLISKLHLILVVFLFELVIKSSARFAKHFINTNESLLLKIFLRDYQLAYLVSLLVDLGYKVRIEKYIKSYKDTNRVKEKRFLIVEW